jgi:peptidyl-prolyl cis-trans isomerase A (cyclophilin A)
MTVGACRAERPPAQSATPPEDPTPTVVLETTQGTIVMELDRANAPLSVKNFLALVRVGFYDGLVFHRVMPGFMIQAGYYTATTATKRANIVPVPYEGDNGLRNRRATVAMARTDDPNSATTQFFINLVDNGAKLDHDSVPGGVGYAVFGRVIEGMNVVDAIARVPTARRSRELLNWPTEPIVITRATVREESGPTPQ